MISKFWFLSIRRKPQIDHHCYIVHQYVDAQLSNHSFYVLFERNQIPYKSDSYCFETQIWRLKQMEHIVFLVRFTFLIVEFLFVLNLRVTKKQQKRVNILLLMRYAVLQNSLNVFGKWYGIIYIMYNHQIYLPLTDSYSRARYSFRSLLPFLVKSFWLFQSVHMPTTIWATQGNSWNC